MAGEEPIIAVVVQLSGRLSGRSNAFSRLSGRSEGAPRGGNPTRPLPSAKGKVGAARVRSRRPSTRDLVSLSLLRSSAPLTRARLRTTLRPALVGDHRTPAPLRGRAATRRTSGGALQILTAFSVAVVCFVLAAALWACVVMTKGIAIMTIVLVLVSVLAMMVRAVARIYLTFMISDRDLVSGQFSAENIHNLERSGLITRPRGAESTRCIVAAAGRWRCACAAGRRRATTGRAAHQRRARRRRREARIVSLGVSVPGRAGSALEFGIGIGSTLINHHSFR